MFEEHSPWRDLALRSLWCWHQKALIGQPSLTVGGSFCQERCLDRPRTVRVRERRRTVHTHTHARTRTLTHTQNISPGIRKNEEEMHCTTKQENEEMKVSDLSEIRGDGPKEKWKYKGVHAWGGGVA